MSKFFARRNPPPEVDLAALDSYLQRALIPVFPSQNFVQDLQSRLLRESLSHHGLRNLRLFQFMFITTSLVAGVSILMITGLRVLMGLLSLVGLVHLLSKPREP